MEMSIIISIPKKEYETKNPALTSRAKQQNIIVAKSTLSVNNSLRSSTSVESLSEQLTEVVTREFAKIKETM